jgi:polysaccharide biosynthesis/export protein
MTVLGIGYRGALLAVAGFSILTTGCAGLPSSGPTARHILSEAAPDKGMVHFNIVPLDAANVDALNAAQHAGPATLSQLGSADTPSSGLIGPGDTLQINLYEAGVSLFSGSRATATAIDTFDASAHGQEFPPIVVDADGDIRLPFAGKIHAAGMTTGQVAQVIERQYAHKSQAPQAVVTIDKSIFSSVVVTGDVRKPGRISLTSARERLIDVIADAGGTELPIDDVVVRFARGDGRAEQRLGDIAPGSIDDVVLHPGDRVEVVRAPRSFTVFGSPGKVSEVAFESARVSLAEAIARVGGPNDAFADPTAIFLFRLSGPDGANGNPNIYRISMLDPRTYFLAQKVMMQDNDLIYMASARSNQASKFVAIINQLFSPAVAVRTFSN